MKKVSFKITASGDLETIKYEISAQLLHLHSMTQEQINKGGNLEDVNSILTYSECDEDEDIEVEIPLDTSEFTYVTLTYEGKEHIGRDVLDQKTGQVLTIAPNSLNFLFQAGGYISTEARRLDEQIYYYASPEEMKLSDTDLFNLI